MSFDLDRVKDNQKFAHVHTLLEDLPISNLCAISICLKHRLWCATASNTGRPGQLLSADHMKVQMVDRLASVLAVVDHKALAVRGEAFLLRGFCGGNHEVAQQRRMAVIGLAQLGQALTILGDNEEVNLGDGIDIAEGEAHVVLVDDVRRDLLSDDLVEDGDLLGRGGLRLTLLVHLFYYYKCLSIIQ